MNLLKELTQTVAVSGSENNLFELIKSEIKDFVDDIYSDSLGNLIAHKRGEGKKLLFAAHTDEIGIMANYIDDNGFVRFAPVGGLNLNSALFQRVVFENGTIGTVCLESKCDVKKDLKISTMYIDIGAKNKEEAQKLVSAGDTASFVGEFVKRSTTVVSKGLDNRAGVYILIEAIKQINHSPFDLYFVFSSQEELGMRGSRTATYNIEPDYAISLDVTDTGDTPNCKTMDVKLCGGAAIKIMDNSVITNRDVRNAIEKCAKESSIPYQFEILTFGGTDAGAMQLVKSGTKAGAISLPVRYIHTPCETADIGDITACITLVSEFSKKDFILD